jgi:uncharacterized protein (DUF302 family)
MDIGTGRTVDLPYEAALTKVEEALKRVGFGVLTRIDVKATMKEKLGVEFTPFVILGACNPPLAHRALQAEPEIGLMLPCNVVVREVAPGKTRVEAVNATALASLFPKADLSAVADEIGERLARVLASV